MKVYITTAFSPMMMGPGVSRMSIVEILDFGPEFVGISGLKGIAEFVPAVGHEVTAEILRPIIDAYLPTVVPGPLFNRVSISLGIYDHVLAIIPNFRASEAREFTAEEVLSAGFRAFLATPDPEPDMGCVDQALEDFRKGGAA